MPKEDPELVGARLADAVKLLTPELPAYAGLSRQYFMELKAQGFKDVESLYLTSKFIETVIFGKNR